MENNMDHNKDNYMDDYREDKDLDYEMDDNHKKNHMNFMESNLFPLRSLSRGSGIGFFLRSQFRRFNFWSLHFPSIWWI